MTQRPLTDMIARHCWRCHHWWHTNTTPHATDTLRYCPDCIGDLFPVLDEDAAA